MMSARQHSICIVFVLGILCLLNSKTEAATILPPVLPHGSNFVGEGTNELASELLQGFVNEEKNFVFSPLGYTVTLGVLAEGARGNTRNQLVTALHLPEDTYAVRQTFKKVLGNLRSCLICDDNTDNVPQFKNWFYVYKNFTIDESYKKILEENYVTDVLSVERPDEETDMNIDVQFTTESEPTTEQISSSSEEDQTASKAETTTNTPVNSAAKFENEALAALSVNKISAKEKGSGREIVSKMITFNGLYYRGKWSTPFEIIKDAEEKSFYVSNDKKKPVTMLRTEGIFEIGNLPVLDATAIELPYTGDRYSLLILLPNARDGLVKLTADLAGYSLSRFYMKKQLTSKMAEIYLPKFMFQTISKPEKVLKEFGVQDLFSDNADLSGISSNAGLFLDELVQLVTVEVDERSTQTNFITAGGIESTRNNFEKIKVDHPFLFFVRDKIDNVIIAAGKVLDPTKKH